MNRGCIWATIIATALFLLVAGVILPRTILQTERCRPTPTPIPTLSASPDLTPTPTPTVC